MVDEDSNYWKRVAESDPYWAVLSQEKFHGSALPEAVAEEFYAHGERDIAFVHSIITKYIDPGFSPKSAIDFGCGVGRLVLPMSQYAEHVYGVDVAPRMLELAQAAITRAGKTNITVAEKIPFAEFDWINSYIVFQHIMPRDGIALLKTLLGNLAVGGIISLHFTIFRDHNVIWRGIVESTYGRFDGTTFTSYERGEVKDMPIYEYDLSEVMMVITRAGIGTSIMRHTDHGGSHGVLICGRKEV